MIKKVEHVALIVKDMDESIDYYSSMFGFKLRIRGKNPKREMAFIYHENQPGFEIELIRDIEPLGTYSTVSVVNHLAFTVDNIDEEIAYYKEKGIQFKTEKPNDTLDGGRMIFFDGPNGELLQFVEPGNQ